MKALTMVLTLIVVLLPACLFGPSTPKPPPYTPKFSYAVQKAGSKIDVTVGLIAPQFTGDGTSYWKENKADDTAKAFVSGLRASFNELLIGKGFNVAGPYDSLDNMTFPEKKGSDFVLYPEMDVSGDLKVENLQTTENSISCDIVISVGGNISLIVKEPLSGEKMWVKRIEVTPEKKSFKGDYKEICLKQAVSQDIKDEWGRAHEALYQVVMQGLDKYVNGEEFQTLKKQAAELRAKKTY